MPASSNLPTDFNDAVVTETILPVEKSAKDETGTPYCLKHHVRMKQTSGGKKGSAVAYFACPVDGCDEKMKRVKTRNESSIPSEPHICPRCSTHNKSLVLSRSKRLSTAFYTILECPNCNYKSGALPRPEFVNSQSRAKWNEGRSENIGDR